ncbi:MAG: tetratricopeptide repeat protein [Desulfobacteraceae bacterium]|nr:MAG: tetratricopeptide repeat protein [Desulfobacteraceae bacterium]
MSNQRVSNERKRELEQIDPFQENIIKGMAYAKENQKLLLVIFGSIALIAIIFSSIIYSFRAAESNASSLVSQAEKKYSAATDPVKGYSLVEADFTTIFEEYANTAAGRAALIKFANICFKAGEFEKASTFFKDALDEFDSDPDMKNILLSSLGHTAIAMGNPENAATWFKKVADSKSDLLKDEAQFSLGLLAQTNAASAAGSSPDTFFKAVTENYPDSIYQSIAQNKLKISK